MFRRLDELFTSIVLNLAEGNGRFSDADQVRFLGMSHELAVFIDKAHLFDPDTESRIARFLGIGG